MGKIKHYLEDGRIVRETKTGNKIERKEVTEDEFENYETAQSVFGCIGYVVMFVIIIKIIAF